MDEFRGVMETVVMGGLFQVRGAVTVMVEVERAHVRGDTVEEPPFRHSSARSELSFATSAANLFSTKSA